MLTYDEIVKARTEFAGVKEDVARAEALGLEYQNPLTLLKAMAELGLTLCDRYERDALSRPNYPLTS